MSAALVENDPDLALSVAEEVAAVRPRKPKKRNTDRRQVVNLPDDLRFHLVGHLDEFKCGNIPEAIRMLVVEALRARGTTPAMMKVAWHQHLANEAAKEDQE